MEETPKGWNPDIYSNFAGWQKAMLERDSVKRVLGVMENEEVKSDGSASRHH